MATYTSRATFHDDSDADDEYERSVITSPTLPAEFDASPTDSESLSTEHTPTTFTHSVRDGASPRGLITDWSAEQCADFISSIGLPQYADRFLEESIAGDAVIALTHTDLKEIGITSIGHRLTILKGVYDVKVKQNISIEPEHYIPLSAESETQETAPTQDDIARIIHIIKDRDSQILSLRENVERLSEENRKLREDILPLVKQAKDRSQPLPTPEDRDFPSTQAQDSKSTLNRAMSIRKLLLKDSTMASNKNPSPTSVYDGRPLTDTSNLDPSAAALAATNHLTASIRDQTSPNATATSPTSPAYSQQAPNSGGPPQRGFPRSNADDSSRDTGASWNTAYTSPPDRREPLSGGNTPNTTSTQSSLQSTQSGSSNPQVEIFKSFRVSIDDPCHKVLPVALKKYNITADWRQYALYIVHGDQERCLGLNEKPLILFKQLDREGRKPMFMLRKHATPQEGHTIGGGGGGFAGGGMSGPGGVGVQLPGGVL